MNHAADFADRRGLFGNAWRTFLAGVLALVMAGAIAVRTRAQSATTSLRGTVTDASGGVVPGAQVMLEDEKIGFSRSETSNSSGQYQFLEVPPGTYSVSVVAKGFKTAKKDEVVLQVNTPTTLNIALAVGASDTVVEVKSAAPAVNTVDATLGNPFDSNQILALPSEGRNAVELLSLQAGVTYVGNQVDTAADSRGGSVSGARSDQTNISVDGLDNNDQLLGNAFNGVLRIPMDSLEEFRVTTTNSNADDGRSSGAQVSLVTKSGTNQFHGTLYEYNRTSLGQANDWFNKQAEGNAGLPNKPGQLIRNTFGAAAGGPIVKNRMFFFANYEGQRSREAVQVNQSVPSQNLRQGIVTYVYGFDQNTGAPLTQTLQPADIASIDQGCLISGTCPAGNGVSQAVLNLWNGGATLPNGKPVPAYPFSNTSSGFNTDGYNILGFTFAAPQPTDLNTYLVRLDMNLTANGNHRLFIRGDLQNDFEDAAPQFPGQPPSYITHNNSKEIAAGYTSIFSASRINNLRYAFIRQGLGDTGDNPYSYVVMWNIADPVSFNRTTNVNVPVHQVADDFTWTHGKHTTQFGGNWRLVLNNRYSNNQNFLYGSSHPDWLFEGEIANTGQDLDPAISPAFPAVDPSFQFSYDAAIADVTGLIGSIQAAYNQLKTGPLDIGALVPRHFRANETEFYVQDAWQIKSNLTLTYGLRYTLLQPPYETSGNQVASDPTLRNFFDLRTAAMLQGQTYQPPDEFSFSLSGQANGGPPFWNWDHRDIAPRLALAYSPNFDSGWRHKIFGDSGKSSIRFGYGIYYDHFGEGVVNTFDRQGSFGLTTYLENPSGVSTTDCVVRFVSLTTIPATNGCPNEPGGPPVPELQPPPPPGFPQIPPGQGANGSFAIVWGLDNSLRTPYSHVFDFSLTRELPHDFVIEASYVGRLARRLLQEVDMAEPLDIRDPKSGVDYFQAATQLVKLANANTPESSVQPIAYWEDLFPGAAGPSGITGAAPGIPANPSATQNIYDLYFANGNNATYALQSLDTYCFPACSTLGPYAYWNDQFSSAFAWRSSGVSNYNALQMTLRRHAGPLTFDLNYTLSKSLDTNSNAERVSEYENGSAVAVSYSGQVINAWQPRALYAPSDFDTTHQINANWILELPFGQGRKWGSDWNRATDAILGGWVFSGLTRWTSGYPFSISTYAFATDYEQDGRAVLTGPAPKTGAFLIDGTPNVFQQGTGAASSFRYAYPGEAGQRNNLRGPGYFGTDLSLAKYWHLTESQSLRFSWDVFNATNAVRFDVGSLNQYLLYSDSLGNFTQTLTKPRVMQFSLRYIF